MTFAWQTCIHKNVLIPSFKGLLFKSKREYVKQYFGVLIPSFKGLLFKYQFNRWTIRYRVLIPSFKSLLFKLLSHICGYNNCLNPFF